MRHKRNKSKPKPKLQVQYYATLMYAIGIQCAVPTIYSSVGKDEEGFIVDLYNESKPRRPGFRHHCPISNGYEWCSPKRKGDRVNG